MVVPLLNIPIISVVLLLLAGILIGHLIWYRDRGDDESTLLGLRGENNELQGALHEHKQAYLSLESELEDYRKEWDQLRSANKQLELAHQATDHDISELNNEIARLQQLKDQAFHDLDQERQQRRALQEALGKAEDNTVRATNLTEQLQSQISAFESERDEISQLSYAKSAERESIESELRDQVEKIGQQRDALRGDCERLTAERDELRQQMEQLTALKAAHEQLQQTTDELEQERELLMGRVDVLDKLEAAHEELQQSNDEIRNERDQLQGQIESFTNVESAVATERDEARRRVAELEELVKRTSEDVTTLDESILSLRAERDELTLQVDDERSTREQLQQQVAKVEELIGQRDSALDNVATLQQQLSSMQDQLAAVDADKESRTELVEANETLQEQLESLSREHETVTTMLADERTRLSKMEAENHRLSLAATESSEVSEKQTIELKTQIETQVGELETLRTELEETAALLSRERHQREHLQTVLLDRKQETEILQEQQRELAESVGTLETQNDALLSQVSELDSLRGEHASIKRMFEETNAQLSQTQEASRIAASERDELVARISELNHQTTDLTQRIASISGERDEMENRLGMLAESQRSTINGKVELETVAEQLRNENESLQQRLTTLGEIQDDRADLEDRIGKLVAQRDEAQHTQAELQDALTAVRGQMESQSRNISSLNQQKEQLSRHASEFGDLRHDNETLREQLVETARQIQRLELDRDERELRARELEIRNSQLEERSKANEETIRNLRRERAAVISRPRPSAFTTTPFASRSIPEETGGRMRHDEVLGMVYTQPPKRKDDLKRISGIAQVLEKKLNAFGVYTYRQIMEWDPVAVAEFSKLLSFRDRIERDDWIGQARNLHYEAYGRAA